MAKNFPVIPETVADQIRLWEAERNRVVYDRGVLYDGFPTEESYNVTVKYAKDSGVYIWHLPSKKMLMVTEPGHDLIRSYMKKIFQ
jgi:transcription initiation factor TFIIH subunit 4